MKVLGVLDLSLNLEPVDREIADVQMRVALVTGIQILLIAVFIYLLHAALSGRPIRELIEGTKAVSAMDLDKPDRGDRAAARNWTSCRAPSTPCGSACARAMAEINQFTQSLETKVEERTEQLKAAHQKLLQSDRLASLGQLSASVAHEINNPISGVLNLSMLMQRILKDDGIPPERIAGVPQVPGAGGRARPRAWAASFPTCWPFRAARKPQRAPADLNKIVRTTLSLVSAQAEAEQRGGGDCDLAEDLPPVLLRRLADAAGGARTCC